MKISREVKTALLVIAGIVLLIFGFNYLKGQNLLKPSNTYYTEFDYNALSTSSPVTLNGNEIGKVVDIKLDFQTKKTMVYFSVDPKLEFTKQSKVRLYEMGVMDGNAISLIESKEGDLAKPGDFIESEVQKGLLSSLSENFSGLSDNLDHTLISADTLLVSLNKFVNDDGSNGLKTTISQLNRTLKSFEATSNSLNGIMSNNDEKIASILTELQTSSKNLAGMLTKLNEANLDETIKNLNSTLSNFNRILGDLDKGNGSIGKLLKDDKLYNNLEGATGELEALLKDIKLHPKRYFRILSKKEIPYSEEETN
ncbi:MlaD family protein [Seonamhaeicola marinus]|uniref:MCE family protein n=1 Tax=Seonamhaeicola marinus TaxID=1912246 RepID=A0A5D0I5J4_9FLAO|nr:MlaD family protein [Seonamhaeicola marinus]TYA78648.1 MCE family protein [Seonamhaeicola marinus]